MRMHHWRRVGALAVWLAPAVATPAAAQECSGCTTLGSLRIALSSIEPAEPMVGDEVIITYSYEAFLPGGFSCGGFGGGSCSFLGGEPYLAGDEPPTVMGSAIVVQRTAVQAGVATIRLDARAMTERECFVEGPGGCISFFEPAFLDASSGPFELDLAAAPAPPPDDDGCAIGDRSRPGGSMALAFLLVPALLLRAVAGRRDRSYHFDPDCAAALAAQRGDMHHQDVARRIARR